MIKMAEKPTNVISWKDAGPDDIVWRYEHDNIRTASVLVVREYEVAAFFRDGQLFDIMPPGKHTITTGNLPLLTKAYSKLLGYKETPFKADIVFVSMKMHAGKWGIRTTVQVSETNQLMVPMMANGDYQFRVNDATVFLTQVVGGGKNFSAGGINNFMRGFMAEQISQQLAKQYYMEAMRNQEKASTTTKVLIEDYFTQRGMELLAFKIGDIQTDAKSQDEINKLQRVNSAGGMQLRQLEAMENVADGLGQGGGGAAIGAGMFMMPQMMNQMQPANGQQNQAPKAVCQSCGGLNDYPYKFCKECGKPPMAQQQAAPAAPAGAVCAECGAANPATYKFCCECGKPPKAVEAKAFSKCPFCGESLNLPKPPKFCPYCSEQLQ